MRTGENVAISIVIGVFVIVGGIGACVSHMPESDGSAASEVEQLRIRLLCETDPEVLLDACREISTQVLRQRRESGIYVIPELSECPEVIRALQPHSVAIDREGIVKIEMYTGQYPLGVYAFPEGRQKPSLGYGDRRLLDGLWYYEDGYSTHPDAYDKMIDELLNKCGKPKIR